ncbi:type I-C CRISPR-associated protein Cas8c/Csd1 [Neisseria canis]|uniref:CRISPR-associated protein Cas8c/Csd1, subtype I-C/DVULG n=1 Tax=Neisseria canis TaxID=493 RepID=A0A1X3CY52_9NEIS|nr:type I-C CRISPR-associated protein Cas8c/Csd1 [Neisseria canis]OSI12558.1 type I-C CRISPR-associated protein Cas8c/Csd1 [Neisseria canis]VEF03423.1 CRISPR-associated protein Cas8c/Csd1, subtype I-C/DVULG [Neisseria canis]
MSWMQKLYRTYEAAEKNPDLLDLDKLAPLWHSPQTAHIQINLDEAGNFLSAKVLTDKPIVMLPVTESSEGRTSGLAPHALADSLQYIARDLGLTYSKEEIQEIEGKNGKKKKVKIKKEDLIFNLYIEQLDKWCLDTFNPKVLAIQKYLHKGTVLEDLIKEKIIPTDENGNLLDNWIEKENEGRKKPELFNVLTKEQGKYEIRKALVIWSVEIPKHLVSATWEDKSVQQDWGRYYQSTLDSQFCIITGNEEKIRESHPAKLTYTGDKAKLVSSNDKEGYTYRGRFETANQASSISAEISHKSHAALRWLIARQGIRNGDQVTVAWALSGKEVLPPLKDTFYEIDWDNLDTGAVEVQEESVIPSVVEDNGVDWSVNIGRQAAQILKQKLHGMKKELKEHEQISLLMLDSATPGRMALTYYQEFLPIDYFANLDTWVDDFSWYQRHSIEQKQGKKAQKQTVWAVLPPSPMAIGEAVYGAALNDTLKKQLYARLLPVIAGGQAVPIPDDLVRKSFQTACNPNGCEHWEWERNIGVACALYKGWRARHYDSSQKRTYSMDLDIENRSRDYLFGRLLAVAEKLESTALRIADEDRATTAERYMQRFVVRPLSTWLQIEANLTKSYKDRLRNNRYMGFLRNREKEIDEIMFALNELRDKTGCSLDAQLDGEFLLGYHSQKMAYRNQSNAQAQPDTQETENN